MIYDCFIFNSELDLLSLRLAFLNDTVDYFVLVESPRTLAGQPKPLHYKNNNHLFKAYHHKIIYLEAPVMPELSAWDYEYFQRNYIKEGLKNCADDDLVLVSDVDEIVNLPDILALSNLPLPCLIELPYYYYFFNLRAHRSFAVNLLAPYGFIKNKFIGERNDTYKTFVFDVIKKETCKTGWHFSYLFGFDIPLYSEKIKSFSHQEFNTPYFLQEDRIIKCVKTGIDLFERDKLLFSFKNPRKDMAALLPFVKEMKMEHLIYEPGVTDFVKPGIAGFFFRKKIIPFIKHYAYTSPRTKLIMASSPLRKKTRQLISKLLKST